MHALQPRRTDTVLEDPQLLAADCAIRTPSRAGQRGESFHGIFEGNGNGNGKLIETQVYEKLTSIPAISYRHMRSTRRHGALGAQQETPGNTHAVCDSGRQVAALIVDAKRKLEMPIATSTIREIRENAVKVGLQGEAVSPRYLPVEEALDEVGAGVRR